MGKHLLEVYPWLTEKTSTALTVLRTGQAIINQPQVMELSDGTNVNSINTAFPLKNKDGILGVVFLSNNINTINSTSGSNYTKPKRQRLGAKYTFDDIITQNEGILNIINKLKKVSRNNSNIFIYGETGTGKELFVHAIHNASNRANKPFISQNCAAIPESLMESLIFGTTAGSFTGSTDKKGLFELANGGTIYLDEINSMPLTLQSKLLRVLEDGKVRRIGGKTEYETDVRIIASTNEAPDYLLRTNKLREDLFYRLSVVNVEIPPLRERKDDIEYLYDFFIKDFNATFGEHVDGIDSQVRHIFMDYDWPGNIRELKNCIEGAFNSVEGTIIQLKDMPSYISKKARSCAENSKNQCDSNIQDRINENFLSHNELSLKKNQETLEKNLIKKALKESKNNITQAAKLLEVPRQSVYNKIKKYNIEL
ncbi:putative sigma54 specific transcriptional regulator [Natranaerobius thermophilus JW/NM-WN-LF]|uniref:Putative sigma54 specific transcriptional regulator n=1 Tax=Natranaerobius thermophilus (strain ATCC BAA-1301 / DSM 18059 / JW/NM-WN-LF) TaxID=457570 RepID=B2A603_NATTJ|nr:putative sigma54 specific transcriptional regulator [Natranaerobius thermophilus JW/NM-WN-LF]